MTEEQNQTYQSQPGGPDEISIGGELDHSNPEDVTTGGELNHTEEPAPLEESDDSEDDEPVDAAPVEVAPAATPVDPEAKTTKIHGKKYVSTPESGLRRI